MRISHKYKFIFFCNPKTGSESVRELLEPYSDVSSTVYRMRTDKNPFYSHMTPQEAKVIFDHWGWDFNDYTKFVFVRNPWSRLVSLYKMITQREPEKDNSDGFIEWLYTVRPFGSGGGGEDWKRWRKYGTYSLDNYASDGEGKLLVDKVIKLENIAQELLPFLQKLELPDVANRIVPHVNKRDKKYHYTEYYSDDARRYVERLYSYDIENFEYKFSDK